MLTKQVETKEQPSDVTKQRDIDVHMKKILDRYPEVFVGIGSVKWKPIHILSRITKLTQSHKS